MSTEYHKISTPFKRHFDGPNKGKLIMGDWALPELDYLSSNYWEFTEKVDGTNIRIEFDLQKYEVEFKGRTDNANIPKHLMEYLDETFMPYDMQKAGLSQVTLYGEGYGPKIQKGGGNYRSDASFVLFDVKIGDFWLERDNVNDIANKLGIDSVPVIGKGTLWDAIAIVKGDRPAGKTFNVEYGYWNGRDGMKSQWGDFEAEGIVARPTVPLFNRQGNRIITKIKGVDFR